MSAAGWLVWLSVLAAPVPSGELLAHPQAYDGRTVVFEGEAIQDVMPRGDHLWLNVHDGANALGVWLPAGMLPPDTRTGDYHQTGDRLRVTAVFRAACPEHGGEVDLHATAVERIGPAQPTPHPIAPSRALLLAFCLPPALLLATAAARLERRRRGAPVQPPATSARP